MGTNQSFDTEYVNTSNRLNRLIIALVKEKYCLYDEAVPYDKKTMDKNFDCIAAKIAEEMDIEISGFYKK